MSSKISTIPRTMRWTSCCRIPKIIKLTNIETKTTRSDAELPHTFLVHCLLVSSLAMGLLLAQASNLDLFSATQPNEFAGPLSFLLEF